MALSKMIRISGILQHLVKTELTALHFAADMSMWTFSNFAYEAHLHVQCSYRIVFQDATVLCQQDAYEKLKDNTICICMKRDLLKLLCFPVQVCDVIVQANQDIIIRFDNGLSLFVYADAQPQNEQWRYWEDCHIINQPKVGLIAQNGTIRMTKTCV